MREENVDPAAFNRSKNVNDVLRYITLPMFDIPYLLILNGNLSSKGKI